MSVERLCDVCGEPYEARRPNSRFCSPMCRQRNARRGSEPAETATAQAPGPVDEGVLAAARSDDQLAALIALRDTLAAQIDSSRDPFGLPALADKLVKVLTEIAKLRPAERKGTALDELARRRKARGVPSGQDGAEGRQNRR